MSEYEKLGAFYLGKEYDVASRKRQEGLLLYDSKDLTTHGVIIGMTGSGKTWLGKRVFLLNNVHENAPVTFETRWVLSYLRGPLTREQIKILMAHKKSTAAPAQAASPQPAAAPAATGAGAPVPSSVSEPPVVAPGINVMYLATSGAARPSAPARPHDLGPL